MRPGAARLAVNLAVVLRASMGGGSAEGLLDHPLPRGPAAHHHADVVHLGPPLTDMAGEKADEGAVVFEPSTLSRAASSAGATPLAPHALRTKSGARGG